MILSKWQRFYCLTLGAGCLVIFQNCGAPSHLGGTETASSTEVFAAAQKVLTQNCVSCHNSNSEHNFDFSSEGQFILSDLVKPGNPLNSRLIYRLRHSKTPTASASKDPAVLLQNMPPNRTLTDEEYQAIYNWVLKMEQNSTPLVCNPDDNLLKPQIKRLTGAQFRNSIEAAFGKIFTDNQFPTLNDSNPRLSLASDPALLTVNEVNVTFFYDSVSLLLTTAVGRTADLVSCVSAANDSCYTTLLQNYSLKLWRRPITAEEQTDLQNLISEIPSSSRSRKIQTFLAAMILSPNHLFRAELGSQVLQASQNLQLSHYEVASLLSFSLWDAPPDSILLELARTNQLYTQTVLKEQANRMMADARFTQKMSLFIVDLLKIEDVKTVEKDPSYNLLTSQRNDLYSSALSTISTSYSSPDVSLYTPFTTQSFSVNQNISRFFNLTTAETTAQLTPMMLNAGQRYGMLSHPAFLTSMGGQVESGIVKRGVFALEQLLCYHMGPVPQVRPTVDLPVTFNPELLSSREVLQQSHSSQSSCIGCHASIDPAGFGFENFNAIGQFRTTEKNNIPIDASGMIPGVSEYPLSFNDSVSFFRTLEKSSGFKKCIQNKFFLYTIGQSAEVGPGQCEQQNLSNKLKGKEESLKSLFESFVELDSFTRRKPASE